MELLSWIARLWSHKEKSIEPVKKPRKPRRPKEEIQAEKDRNRLWLIEHNKRRALEDRDRQLSIGVTHYKWQACGDERVCEACAANDGKVFNWNDLLSTGYPGEGLCCQNSEGYCRCIALAQIDESKG